METTSTPVVARRTWQLWERPTTAPRYRFQYPRDLEIVRTVFRHRFATPALVHALLGGSAEKIGRRMRHLWRDHYLERPRGLRPTTVLTTQLVYSLGRAGANLLAQHDPHLRTLRDHDWTEEPKKQIGAPYIDHDLSAATFLVALELACRARGMSFDYDGHFHRQRHYIVLPNGERMRPDAYFRLRLDGRVAHHYLELDRANVNLARMRERYANYLRSWHERRLREPGFRFRVLTVAPSRDYMQSLRRVARDIGRDQAHPRAWRGLLFTSSDAYDLAHPERILESIFYHADDEHPVALV